MEISTSVLKNTLVINAGGIACNVTILFRIDTALIYVLVFCDLKRGFFLFSTLE